MLAWSVRRGLRADNPARQVRRLQLAGKESYLDEREALAIWNAITSLEELGGIGSQAADCFRLLALTGARRIAIVELKWCKVDLSRGILLLPPLRHTLPSWVVADGASLAIIGKLLGRTTQRYAHLRLDAGTDVVEAVAKRCLLSRETNMS